MFLLPEIALSLVLLVVLYWCLPPLINPRFAVATHTVQNTVLFTYSAALFVWLAPLFTAVLALYMALALVLFYSLKPERAHHRAGAVAALVAVSVGVLAAVKYYNPVREFLALSDLPPLNWVLGFGVSFLTFQYVSLLLWWWRGGLHAQTTPLHIAVFVAFFPTLVAGPITRAAQLLPQLAAPRRMIAPRFALARMVLGVWQMLVCAQWLADTWVNPIYAAPQNHHGLEVAAAALAYSLQIYLDFSGLSNIVLGLGWLLGLRLPRNFRSPYAAWNIREFWRRWHMSLSTWIRDYLYKPLGGSRKGFVRAQVAVTVSMLLSGIWHGAALTFLVWAALHVLAMIALNVMDKYTARSLPQWLGTGVTFVWVSAAWVFFRADSLEHAVSIFTAMGGLFTAPQPLPHYNFLGFAGLLLVFFTLQAYGAALARRGAVCLRALPAWGVPLWLVGSVWTAIELGPTGVPNFIYAGF